MATTADVRHELASLADPRRAEGVSRFLQMIPGGYGEGDRAIGVSVPEQRRVAGPVLARPLSSRNGDAAE